jgi:hypothetical protein
MLRRRDRLMAGILTSLTLTISMAETVTASMCALPPSRQDDAATAESTPAADDCMMSTSRGHGSRNGQPCPFGPAAAVQGCIAAASMPAPPVRLDNPWLDSTTFPSIDVQWHDLLFEAILFHPPKA